MKTLLTCALFLLPVSVALASIRAVTPEGKKIVWVDFNDKLVDEKGDTKSLMPDRLYPNAAGYEIWWNEIAKHLP